MSATDTPDTGAVPPRLVTTAGAADLLRRLSGTHGELMMHQSGGCCDGSAPMCYPSGEFIVGDRDVLLGIVDLRLAVGRDSRRPSHRNRRCTGLDFRITVRSLEAHPVGAGRRARPRQWIQPGVS